MAFELIEEYELDGLKCKINSGSGYMGGFNGYITYPKRPLKETGYNGIATYIPVHGGITYAQENKDGSFTYGFDTSHYNSSDYPNKNINWIKEQIKIIRDGIELAKTLEDEYLLAEGNNEKQAEICQKVCDLQPNQHPSLGVMINMFGGKL